MITFRTNWETPPLRSNDDRMHWAPRSKIIRDIRLTGALLGQRWLRAAADQPLGWLAGPVSVAIVWEVTDRRTRDSGASAPTLKHFIDGLVDCGLLAKDSHDVVAEERCRIEMAQSKGVRIEVAPWRQS